MKNAHPNGNPDIFAGVPTILPPLPSPSLKDINILLASNSPRRRELLGMILPAFDIATMKSVEESYPATLAPEKVPEYLSALKASAYRDVLVPGELIITADTVVIHNGKILGKPADAGDARAMLASLCSATHTVVTGVTLTSLEGKKTDTFSTSTKVTFGPLADDEIAEYVDRYMPLDKAGSYGIQEWIGAAAIERIDGCFYNVMGLPLHDLFIHLKDFFA